MNTGLLSQLSDMVNRAAQLSEANHENMQKLIDQADERSRQMARLVDILHSGIEQSTSNTCKIIQMIPRYSDPNNTLKSNTIRVNLTDYQLRKSL